MAKLNVHVLLAFLCFSINVFAQEFAKWEEGTVVLDNGVIRRVIQIGQPNAGLVSSSITLHGDKTQFLSEGSGEFSFEIDEKLISGSDGWQHLSTEVARDEGDGHGVTISLEHPQEHLTVAITYLIYPDLPIIRKKMVVTNTGTEERKLESMDVESVHFAGSGTGTECWVLNDFARQKSLGKFIGTAYDPLVLVHNVTKRHGFILGNEALGVMKRTSAFVKADELTIGLTHADESFAFRSWLKPGESWESPWVFSGVYADTSDPWMVINGPVNDFVRRHMGIRLNAIEDKPTFVYNTWNPFRTKVNAELIRDVAKAAAECGVQEFIIDDGWQINIGSETSKELWGNNYGDWEIDQQKFPGGLKPTFDYIKSLGMKPGLWISIGSATGDAKVFKEHPEWFVKNYKQRLGNLHFEADSSNFYSSCYGTDWFDYIKNAIVKLAREHGLAYAKLDFAVITSAYVTDDHNAGCFAVDHPYHKDQNESFLVIYNRVMELFDELHTEAPGLFIDCTFETVGKLQLMDYAIAKHAEGNWLSNFEEPSPLGPLRVRHMAWWRSPVLPATSLVIGNQQMDDPDFLLSFKSLAGTLPIVLGDPRKLSETQRKEIRTYADWLKAMQQKHDFTSFRQDLAGFGEPMEGHWDGFQRINSETKSGGIVGIFRQGATEEKRMVTVLWLDPKAEYVILNAPDGKQITKLSGKELMELGFEVKLAKKYDGVLFEILKVI